MFNDFVYRIYQCIACIEYIISLLAILIYGMNGANGLFQEILTNLKTIKSKYHLTIKEIVVTRIIIIVQICWNDLVSMSL